MLTPADLLPHADRPIRILLVDDESAERAAVLLALQRGGLAVDVAEAHDLTSAAAALAARPYDCVLVDAALPDRGVEGVIEHAARHGATPAIALTAGDVGAPHSELATRGAADRLPKRLISSEWLTSSVLHVLRARTLLGREAEAREALSRYSQRLHALVEGSERIHAARAVEGVAEAAAAVALALFEARAVRLELAAPDGPTAVAHAAAPEAAAARGEAVTVELNDSARRRVGAITLEGVELRDADAALLAQLARTTVSALENAWLLRRAKEASLARDEVLAVVSHDLRSPVSTVTLGARMLRASLEARGRDFDDDALVVRRIERACERMSRLIENLLDAAQLEEGPLRVRLQPWDAAELVREAVDAAAVSAEAARVRVRAGALEPLRVLADRERVLQVFSNLVGNALKVTPGGGEVALSAAREGGEVRFSVVDAGPGVPEAQRPTLFKRYARGPGGGHGLGLYISRHIVEAHGGRIEARDGGGGGSVFTFTLPLAP